MTSLEWRRGWILRACSLFLLLLACGDDDPVEPDVAQGYRIRATLLGNMQTATVSVIRIDASDPPALESLVQIDDQTVAAHSTSTPDQGIFQHQVTAELGRAHTFAVTIQGETATGVLLTPEEASSITITQPPPGARNFSPDVPLTLEWEYVGSPPGEFGVFGTNIGSTHLVVSSDTLAADARSLMLQTVRWAFAPQILIRVTARDRSEVSGDLAAPGSVAQVEFAVSEVILNRQ